MTNQAPNRTNGRFISIRWRMLGLFTLLFTIVFGVAFLWFYQFSTQLALDNLYKNLLAVAYTAVDGIDGDIHQALVENPDYDPNAGDWPAGMNDARFWEMATWLNAVHQSNPNAFIYTYTPAKSGTVDFIVSMGAVWNPVDGAPFGFNYEPQPPSRILEGFNGETVSTNYVTDDFGSWVSGFVPIKNSAGETVAALGVDYRADNVAALQTRIRNTAIPTFVLVYLVLFISVWLISNSITAPILNLTKIADRIADGDYEDTHAPTPGIKDEVTRLSEVFELMVSKVRAREQKLKNRVAELQIVIDKRRQAEQVSEITETEFFRDLQNKAYEMRQRHHQLMSDDE